MRTMFRCSVLASTTAVAGLCQAQATFQGLGDLSGGIFQSLAYGVSGDGQVVVGYSKSDGAGTGTSNMEAFRWTASGGMVGLGVIDNTPPIHHWGSVAYAISEDGSVIVGGARSYDSDNRAGIYAYWLEGFRWTASTGMVGIGALPSGYWDHTPVYGVSPDGSVLVGSQ